ncbi:hypothetical protein GBF38_022945, partial [Nibea albiflora]
VVTDDDGSGKAGEGKPPAMNAVTGRQSQTWNHRENYEKNISCNDIKTASGFKFPHNGNEESEIIVTCNK